MLGEERGPFRIINNGFDEPHRRDPGVKEIQTGCQDVWVLQQGMGVKGVAAGEYPAQVQVSPRGYLLASGTAPL